MSAASRLQRRAKHGAMRKILARQAQNPRASRRPSAPPADPPISERALPTLLRDFVGGRFGTVGYGWTLLALNAIACIALLPLYILSRIKPTGMRL